MVSRRKILILDPSPIFRRTLKQMIRTRETDVDVAESENTDQAVDIIMRQGVDVVLLDIATPRHNGVEFIASIKRMAPKARVIVLSSHDSKEYKEASLRNGADFFLSKEGSCGRRLVEIIHQAVRA